MEVARSSIPCFIGGTEFYLHPDRSYGEKKYQLRCLLLALSQVRNFRMGVLAVEYLMGVDF